MARLNWTDFVRGAAEVAKGALVGKLQAQQVARQRQQEDRQNAMQLEQFGRQADQDQLAHEEAYDQQLWQQLSRFDQKSQNAMIQQLNQRAFDRQQRAQQMQQQRMGALPPVMQRALGMPNGVPSAGQMGALPGFMGGAHTPPPTAPAGGPILNQLNSAAASGVPFTPVQPTTNMGPAGTVQQGATAAVAPPTGVTLPTAPTSMPGAGAGPPQVPVQGPPIPPPPIAAQQQMGPGIQAAGAIMGAMGLPGMGMQAAGQQMMQPGGIPPAPMPTAPQPPLPVQPPPINPATGAPGLPNVPAPVPGAGTPDVNVTGVAPQGMPVPGLKGTFNLRGVTPDQVKSMTKDIATARKLLSDYNEDPNVKAALQNALNQVPADISDEDSYHKAEAAMQLFNNNLGGISGGAQRADEARLKGAETRRNQILDQVLSSKNSDLTAGDRLVRVSELDKDLKKKRGDLFTGGEMEPYEADLEEYKQARADGNTDRAKEIAGYIMGDLKNPEPPPKRAADTQAILNITKGMSSEEAKDPEQVAKRLEAFGFGDVAKKVRAGGISFGGYRAEQLFNNLVKQASGWANMNPEARTFFLENLRQAADAAGKQIDLPDDIKKDPTLTPYQKAMISLRGKELNVRYGTLQVAQANHQLAVDKFNAMKDGKLAGNKGQSIAALVRPFQHNVDKAWDAYRKMMDKYAFTDEQLKDPPAGSLAAQAKTLRDQYDASYQGLRGAYKQYAKSDIGQSLTGGGAPAGATTNAGVNAGGIDLSSLPTHLSSDQRQAVMQRLSKMTTAEKLQYLSTRAKH